MGLQHDLTELRKYLAALRDLAGQPDDRLHFSSPSVSRWTPAQHIQHTARALARMLAAIHVLEKGCDSRVAPEGAPSAAGQAILASGVIPRGEGEAPQPTLPEGRPAGLVHDLEAQLRQAGSLSARVEGLAALPGRVPHPALGSFDAAQWLRFAAIHTHHHLEIVRELLKRAT